MHVCFTATQDRTGVKMSQQLQSDTQSPPNTRARLLAVCLGIVCVYCITDWYQHDAARSNSDLHVGGSGREVFDVTVDVIHAAGECVIVTSSISPYQERVIAVCVHGGQPFSGCKR